MKYGNKLLYNIKQEIYYLCLALINKNSEERMVEQFLTSGAEFIIVTKGFFLSEMKY